MSLPSVFARNVQEAIDNYTWYTCTSEIILNSLTFDLNISRFELIFTNHFPVILMDNNYCTIKIDLTCCLKGLNFIPGL